MERLYVEFGRLVRELRKQADLSQSAFAARVGLGRTSITNIELGQQHIPLHALYPIAAALGVSPDALLPKPEFAVPSAADFGWDTDLARHIEKQELEPSAKRWVERVVLKSAATNV